MNNIIKFRTMWLKIGFVNISRYLREIKKINNHCKSNLMISQFISIIKSKYKKFTTMIFLDHQIQLSA